MRARWVRHAQHFAVLAGLAVLGTALGAYVLLHERFSNPLADTYTVNAVLPAAPGIQAGYGQPVTVSGVEVGTISGARLIDGRARVTLVIRRKELRQVFRDATATLRPTTPLGDMEIQLDPGRRGAGALPNGATLPVAQGIAPAQFEDLLTSMDDDTRDFLTMLIRSLDVGTRGRGPDMRAFFRAIGPTTGQAHELATALAARRIELARLVHNVALVMRASTRDRQLATVVQAGNATLRAIAQQETPLRAAIARLPDTMRATRRMLTDSTSLARASAPALGALTPAVRRLPTMFAALRPFARTSTPILQRTLRPYAVESQPLLRNAAPALAGLAAMSPHLERVFRILQYWLNEAAYNPPGTDEGFLYWWAWAGHNLNSWFAGQDADGGLGRATAMVSCSQLNAAGGLVGATLDSIFNLSGTCDTVGRGAG